MTNRQVKSPRSQKTSDNQKQSETGYQHFEKLKFKTTPIQKEPWIANQMVIKTVHCDEQGFHYEILFENFLGGTSKTTIHRADCFVNFPKVIAQLTAGGYSYDVNNPKALDAIRTFLTGIHLDPGDIAKAQETGEKNKKKAN